MIKRFLGAGLLAFAVFAHSTIVVAQTAPTLAACVAAPTTTGCASVLPTLQTCIAKPTTTGCSVVLPTFAQCAKTPSLAGCVAVIAPPPSSSPLPQGHDTVYAMSGGTKNVMPGGVATPTPSPGPPVVANLGPGQQHPTLNCVPGPTPASCASSSTPAPQATTARGSFGTPSPAATGTGANPMLINQYTSANTLVMPSPGPTGLLTIAVCSSLPSAQAGCAAILPTVAACTANGNLAGCPAVLARAKCATTATPVPAGCPFKGIPY